MNTGLAAFRDTMMFPQSSRFTQRAKRRSAGSHDGGVGVGRGDPAARQAPAARRTSPRVDKAGSGNNSNSGGDHHPSRSQAIRSSDTHGAPEGNARAGTAGPRQRRRSDIDGFTSSAATSGAPARRQRLPSRDADSGGDTSGDLAASRPRRQPTRAYRVPFARIRSGLGSSKTLHTDTPAAASEGPTGERAPSSKGRRLSQKRPSGGSTSLSAAETGREPRSSQHGSPRRGLTARPTSGNNPSGNANGTPTPGVARGSSRGGSKAPPNGAGHALFGRPRRDSSDDGSTRGDSAARPTHTTPPRKARGPAFGYSGPGRATTNGEARRGRYADTAASAGGAKEAVGAQGAAGWQGSKPSRRPATMDSTPSSNRFLADATHLLRSGASHHTAASPVGSHPRAARLPGLSGSAEAQSGVSTAHSRLRARLGHNSLLALNQELTLVGARTIETLIRRRDELFRQIESVKARVEALRKQSEVSGCPCVPSLWVCFVAAR